MLPFRVKICGITTPADAVLCAEGGADAIGLNFHGASKRSIDIPTARAILAALPAEVTPVGLFVNEPIDSLRRTAGELGIKWIQLHGDESPADLAKLPPEVSILWARRGLVWGEVLRELERCEQLGRVPHGVLCDARVEGSYGGTGHTADWQDLADRGDPHTSFPLMLAGGLTPQNVREAIAQVQPWGVDTASGVEASPGRKDPELVRAFVEQARLELSPQPEV